MISPYQKILNHCGKHFGVSMQAFRKKRGADETRYARLMYYAAVRYYNPKASLNTIAKPVGKTHCVVHNGLGRHAELMQKNATYRQQYYSFLNHLQAYSVQLKTDIKLWETGNSKKVETMQKLLKKERQNYHQYRTTTRNQIKELLKGQAPGYLQYKIDQIFTQCLP